MTDEKRESLEEAGWKVGTVQEFLGLSTEEAAHVECLYTETSPVTRHTRGVLARVREILRRAGWDRPDGSGD